WTVREAEDSFAPQRVLGVTDFSLHAERALSYAAAFADAFDAELHVLHVIPDAAAFAPSTKQLETSHPWSAIVANMEADAMQRMDAISLADAYPKLTVKKEIRGGLPIAQIVEYIKEQSIDLAACGTHGRGALAQALIGGVAERVVRHATCPVLTVHHPQHEFVTPFAE
ncbi:MAG: universal stress protein, partial [Planctomycetota bacterium]|nr:universal stress protein [Planctomycetota bacterium]